MDRDADANTVPFCFRESWLGTALWEFYSGLCDTITDTNKASLFCFSGEMHLVIVSRWVKTLGLWPSELQNTCVGDPPSPHLTVRSCWPPSTSLSPLPIQCRNSCQVSTLCQASTVLHTCIHNGQNMVLTPKEQTGRYMSSVGETDANRYSQNIMGVGVESTPQMLKRSGKVSWKWREI